MGAICGYAGQAAGPLLNAMLGYVAHRGPADSGRHDSGDVALGYRHEMPPTRPDALRVGVSADGEISCVVDGFFFNQAELKRDLEARGVRFRSDEPSEVLANLFMHEGTSGFTRLDGAFVAAITTPDGLYLVRDSLGEKPLYFTSNVPGLLMFASEIKAFLAHDLFECQPNADALNRLLVFSFIAGAETMFSGVFQLLPGSYVHYSGSGQTAITQIPYWDLEENIGAEDDEYYIERMAELTTAAVQKRLVTDGPVGAFLSGGLDSSAIVAILAEIGVDVLTFSVAFGQGLQNELMYAKLVADHCGVRHHVLHVEPRDFIDQLPSIIWNLDDPLCDCIVVPNYLLAAEAAREVRLLFNGEGGDPLFGGPKNKFMILNEWYKHVGATDTLRAYLGSYHKYYDYLGDLYTPDFMNRVGGSAPLEDFVRPYFEESPHKSFLNKLMYLNTKLKGGQNILVKVDKMLSAHALQAMSPLFDRELAEFSFMLPPKLKRRGDIEKYVFKKAVEDKLPGPVVYRKKAGMGVPLNQWFRRTALRDYTFDLLTSRSAIERGYFDPAFVRRLLRGNMPRKAIGQDRSGELLWMLLAVELWHKVFIDQRGLEPCTTPALAAH